VFVVGAERRLLDVHLSHADLVVAALQIELGEEFGAALFVEQLVDDRDWEHVTADLQIERTVVHTEPPGAVVFLDQLDW
jgi:hypothetical protein